MKQKGLAAVRPASFRGSERIQTESGTIGARGCIRTEPIDTATVIRKCTLEKQLPTVRSCMSKRQTSVPPVIKLLFDKRGCFPLISSFFERRTREISGANWPRRKNLTEETNERGNQIRGFRLNDSVVPHSATLKYPGVWSARAEFLMVSMRREIGNILRN